MKESTRKWNACFMMGLMLTFVISCQDSDFPKSSLDVNPEGKIHFESDSKEEQQLVISTNEAQWDFICHADWVKVSKHLDRLIVSADDNEGLEAREAQIIVVAGGLSKTMPVVQDARGVYFDFEETEFSVPAWSETRTLYLRSNTKEWEAVSDVDWLKVSAEPYLGKIVVEILENKGTEERVGEITLKDNLSNKTTVLKFTQDPADQYLFPIFIWGEGSRIDDIWDAEEARGNELIVTPTIPAPPANPGYPYYEFKTRSKLFPVIKYEPMNYGDTFIFKSILVANDKSVFETDEFNKFIAEQGFKETDKVAKLSNGMRKLYRNDDKKTFAVLISEGMRNEILFIPIVEQPKAMPTIDKLYHFENNLAFEKSTVSDVQQYEINTAGGKRDAWWCSYLTRVNGTTTELFHSAEPFLSRWYFFNSEGKLTEVKYMFSKLDFGYFVYGGLFFITKEFEQLMKANGYAENFGMRDYERNLYVYDNAEKGLRLTTISNIWNEKPVFSYHIFPTRRTN